MRNAFDTLTTVVHALGGLLLALGGLLLLPLVVGLTSGEPAATVAWAYGAPAIVATAGGLACWKVRPRGKISQIQAMLVCGVAWILLSAIAAIAYVAMLDASFVDAYFETVSGFTTTGITLFSGLDELPTSILLWRSLTQWIGGLGILTFFLALLSRTGPLHPLLGAEAHKISAARPVPGVFGALRNLWLLYLGFTIAIFVGLLIGGTGLFDALNHAFTTISTGGFSTHDGSIAHYRTLEGARPIWIEYVLIAGMAAGGTSFLVHYRLIRADVSALWDTAELRWWFLLLFGGLLLLMGEHAIRGTAAFATEGTESFETTLRTTLFQVVAIATTTGYATEDIAGSYFGGGGRIVFLVLMFVGGCVGSTGGGIKVKRIAVLFRLVARELRRIVSPRGARNPVLLDREILDPDEVSRVAGLFFAWVVLLLGAGLLTALVTEHRGYDSLSCAFSALNNIGPCYISSSELAQLPISVKLAYTVAMLAGRLELFPILLVFSPRAWRS